MIVQSEFFRKSCFVLIIQKMTTEEKQIPGKPDIC